MKQKLDLDEIKLKIFKKLEASGWDRVLKSFIFSSDFDDIITQLARLVTDGKRFTPPLKDIFKAFEECPYSDLKVILIGTDPSPQFGVADGIAFSCGKTVQAEPDLKFILQEINDKVYGGSKKSINPDLTRWSNQGILLLNLALTTTVGKTGQHYKIWQPFIAYLFDYLTWNNNGLIYIYLGKEAHEWADSVNENNYKFKLLHPLSAIHNNDSWDSKDVFKQVDKIIKDNYNDKIIW